MLDIDCYWLLKVGKLEFLNSAYFHFVKIVRLLFKAWYVSRRGGANLWVFKNRNVHIYVTDLCMLEILFPSLSEGKNCKILLGYPDANVKFLMGWEFKCNLLCLLNLYNRYWNQVHTKHENLFSILVSKQTQAR